jgi:histidinol phosphatase-like enzyme
MSKVKLSLRSTREYGESRALFIDRECLVEYEGDICLREKDFKVLAEYLPKLNDLLKNYDYCLVVAHLPQVAKGWLNHNELEKMDQKIITESKKHELQIDAVMNCIHSPDEDGVVALCIPCSCHPDRGGLFLQAAVKYNLSLSRSTYLAYKDLEINQSLGLEFFNFNDL